MTPYWDSSARGVIAGLSGSTRRGDLYRALLEGVVLEQVLASRRLQAGSGQTIDHYVAVGGGAASDLWMQILADATGVPVHRSTSKEASSLGAAIAAATGCGWFRSFAEASAAMAGSYRQDLRTEAEREGGLRGTRRDIRRTVANAFELEPQARSLRRAASRKAAILDILQRSIESDIA